MTTRPPGDLVDLRRPGDVVRAAGAWLATRLTDDGFAWLDPSMTLRRGIGTRSEEIRLQGSTRNRTDEQLTVDLHLVVADTALGAWRGAHRDVVLRQDDLLIAHPAGYVCAEAGDGAVDLLDAATRLDVLTGLDATIRTRFLPWFAATADPDRLVTEGPITTLEHGADSIVEWLGSLGRTDLVDPLVRRVLAAQPGYPDRFERGRQLALAGMRPSLLGPVEAFGWTATKLAG